MGVIKITRGVQRSAARVVLYGTEGIGKTTLAAEFPGALILDTESGSTHLDCARVACPDWQSLMLAVTELAVDSQGFKTIVIDSADWAEKKLIEFMLKAAGKRSIEDFGFGKGYVMLQEHVTRFLGQCDALVERGLNVVLVAHSKVARTSPPDQTDGFDRYELKLTKQVAPLLKEWCDALLFATYKMRLVEGADGRMKATGGKTRVLYSERSAAWDAKNRYGLPEEMPMEFSQLASVVEAVPYRAAPGPVSIDSTLDAIASAEGAALERLLPRVMQRHTAGELTAEQTNTLTKAISARLETLAEVVA